MPRTKRDRCTAGLYYVRQRAKDTPLFLTKADKEIFLDLLKAVKNRNGICVFGVCLADEREYHLVLGTHCADLSKVMKELNIGFALAKGKKHLFRDRFESFVLETKEQALAKLDEIRLRRKTVGLCSEGMPGSYQGLIDDVAYYRQIEPLLTVDEVRSELMSFLEKKNLSLESFLKEKDTRNDWIRSIRRRTPVSLRELGNLLALSESSVSKILKS